MILCETLDVRREKGLSLPVFIGLQGAGTIQLPFC